MDRPTAQSVPFVDASADGWDPKAVWRERVLAARSHTQTAPEATLLDTTSGWDPLETWRVRVQGARRAAG
jgi:hypothetical protein